MTFITIFCREFQLILAATLSEYQNFFGKVAIAAKLGVGFT